MRFRLVSGRLRAGGMSPRAHKDKAQEKPRRGQKLRRLGGENARRSVVRRIILDTTPTQFAAQRPRALRAKQIGIRHRQRAFASRGVTKDSTRRTTARNGFPAH